MGVWLTRLAGRTCTDKTTQKNSQRQCTGDTRMEEKQAEESLRAGDPITASEVNPTGAKRCPSCETIFKASIVTLLLGVLTFVILDYTLPGAGHVDKVLRAFLRWVEANPAEGVAAFAGVYMVTTVCLIPGALLTLGAGYVFGRAMGVGLGVLLGSVAVFVGASAGATVAFLVSKYALHDRAQEWVFRKYKIMRAVDRSIQARGLTVILLLRLSPLVPFSALNYVLGTTRADLRAYVTALVGILPGTVAYVFVGTTASGLGGESDAKGDVVKIVLLVLGSVFAVVAIAALSWYSKRMLDRTLSELVDEDDAALDRKVGHDELA